MYNEQFNDNLVNFLKSFQNRPHHLAKFLIDNSALNEAFMERILKSEKAETIKSNFNDIAQMDSYYNSLIDINDIKNDEELVLTLNKKLDDYISDEKFEEAAKLRDYMNKVKIKRLK